MTKPYYPHLLSPLQIGGKVAKNRMGFSRAVPVFTTGNDDFVPLETLELFAGDIARNGAAIVTCPSAVWPSPHNRPVHMAFPGHKLPIEMTREPDDDEPVHYPSPGEMKGFDMNITNTRVIFSKVTEAIHNEGSLACMSMMEIEPTGWNCNEIPIEYLEEMIDDYVKAAKVYKSVGFDILCFYMTSQNSILAKSLSPVNNKRTDKYGGSNMAERSRLSLSVFQAVKKAMPGILIEAQINGEEPTSGGYTISDMIEYLKLGEDCIDIVQVRNRDEGRGGSFLYSSDEIPQSLGYAAAMKKAGLKEVIAPVCGFRDPEQNEQYISDGKCDMIYMARAFLCDYEYGQKVKEGRPQDIVPCLQCNKCHSAPGDPEGGCSLNPRLFISVSDREHFEIKPAGVIKKIAIIGGGPAGMEAAIIASRRGHKVTLYEKEDHLGGQLIHADYFSFKWTMKRFKEYMISQVNKCGAEIILGTEATPELLAGNNFDVIVLAAGAESSIPDILGARGSNIWTVPSIYGRENELGKKVVVIGGSEIGVETGLHLAIMGHKVTVLTRQGRLAKDSEGVHYTGIFMQRLAEEPNFSSIKRATTKAIMPDGVIYTDKKGEEHKIECDSVVLSSGLTPRTEKMAQFAAITGEFHVIGDCREVCNIRRAMKNGYSVAIRI